MNHVLPLKDSKFYLGRICKRGHDYGNGQSMRRTKNGCCVECDRLYSNARYVQRKRELGKPDKYLKQDRQVSNKHYLGKLCPAGHDYLNGQSLRYLSTLGCVECKQLQDRQRKDSGKAREQKRRYCYNNREKVAESRRRYRKTPNGKEVIRRTDTKYRLKRANLLKFVHFVPFTDKELQSRFAQFNSSCAYCGSDKNITCDHFIPINFGGPDCIGNILPCCNSCNSSKQDSDPWEWYKQQVFFKEEQWSKIVNILGKGEVNYNQLPLF